MMTLQDRLPVDALRMLVDQHGLWKVLRAAALAALRRPVRAPVRPRVRIMRVDELSDHLRRDIGLPPSYPSWAQQPPRW